MIQLRKYGVFAGLVVIVAIVSVIYACTSNTSTPAEVGIDQPKQAKALSLQPLDEENNPYRDKYEACDIWTYDNCVLVSSSTSDEPWKSRGEDEYMMAGYADQNGYMLPYKEFVRLQEEAAKAGLARSSVKGYNNVYAVGPMTQELFDETYESAWAVKANYFMPVPDWLIELEPTSSILLPNSDVIVREPLEADSDDGDQDTGCCGGNSEYGFYRYSADGELLGFTRGSWFTLYIDVEADGWPGCNVEGFRKDGYLLATDENGSLLVYNYDGEKLDVANEPPQRDMHGFTALKLTQLQLVHKYQNN